MRILGIRDAAVPLRSPIRNASIDFTEMTVSVVAIITDQHRSGTPLIGFGFNSIGRYAQRCILRERLIPRLRQAAPDEILNADATNFDPFNAWRIMMKNEKPGGHGERPSALGALDMAFWDLVAKVEGKPLFEIINERFSPEAPLSSVPVYAAGGYYYSGTPLARLKDEIRSYLEQGFIDVKIKIGGASLAEDIERIEAVLEVIDDAGTLAVDANGRFQRDTARLYLHHLSGYGLRWYEEPSDPLDFALYADLSAATSVPLATGENLFSLPDVLNLLRYARLEPERDFLQMDPTLSYGLIEYLRILERLHEHGWSRSRCIPHGGHPFLLHVAAGLGLGGVEIYPSAFEPFGGIWNGAIIGAGRASPPDAPGIGFELKPRLMDVFRSFLIDS